MKDGKGSKPPQSGSHPSKSRDEWVAHFPCMLRYAESRVGKTYAREVATDALWNAYQSKRKRPPANDSAAFCEWLMYFVYWASRSFQARELREKKNALRLEQAKLVFLDDYVPSHSDAIHTRLTLAKALDLLSPEERALLCATYMFEYSSGEVAEERGVNKRTLQRQIASLTNNVRQQLKEVRHGVTIFWPLSDVRSALRKLFASTSRALLRMSHHLGWCSMSVMMGGLFPGGIPAASSLEVPTVITNADAGCLPAKSEAASSLDAQFVRHSLSLVSATPETTEVQKTHALRLVSRTILDKPSIDASIPRGANAKPTAASIDEPPIIDVRPSAVVASRIVEIQPNVPLGRLPAPQVPTDQVCFNAFLDAQTAMHYHQDAESCLAHLNQKPDGIDACPDTIERANLRLECLDKR